MSPLKSNSLLLVAFSVVTGAGCVGQQPVVTTCPCTDGWQCIDLTCQPTPSGPDGSAGGGGLRGTPDGSAGAGAATGGDATGGGGGATGGSATGGSGGSTGGISGATGGVGGPGYACGPERTLQCNCGTETYLPAPLDEQGRPLSTVLPPDQTTLISYSTTGAFDALAVGRWRRTAGQAELRCESFGVEFTADHQIIPLAYASDGSIQPVNALARSFTLQFTNGRAELAMENFTTNAPFFSDGGASMQLVYDPWPANYTRVTSSP